MQTLSSTGVATQTEDGEPKLSREIPEGENRSLAPLVAEFLESLPHRTQSTRIVYARTLRQLTDWIAARPGSEGTFHPERLSVTALSVYLEEMGASGYSLSHRARVKAVAGCFARWLMEEKGVLTKNPARSVTLPPQQMLAPRELSAEQRYVLRGLAERDGTARSAALFALGYWAGCRVSDVAHLELGKAHIGPKIGWVGVGFKGGKMRELDLVNEARRPLYEYLQNERRETLSPFFFLSQRHERLTESGVHQWFRTLKKQARKDEWALIQDITFHDLRHDFAHRARSSGWSLEEIAYYLGHVTARGLPAIATTVRYTQVSREQVRTKLRLLRG
jgi:site-specific recombinase XerD